MLRYSSTLIILALLGLCFVSLTMLMSTGVWVRGIENPFHFFTRQAVMFVAGFGAAVVAYYTPVTWLQKLTPLAYLGACVLLAMCFLPGIGVEEFGSKRWIKFPLVGQFQPSEPAKIIVIFALASWFSRWQTEANTFWRGFMLPGFIVSLPLGLIAAETDVGTALSLSVAAGALMFCVGTRLLYMIPTALCTFAFAGWFIYNNPNRWGRIQAWLDLENPIHQLDRGMQQWRALLAMGNGGPWGVGLGEGIEKFGTLTFAHIDFIFPVIGEEYGLRGTLGVVLCYVLIALGGIGIALQARGVYERCLALGITCMIVIPAIINICVTTALLPNDGLPLPFVSYGGTSLIFSLAAVGVLIGIHNRAQVNRVTQLSVGKEVRFAVKL